MSVHATNGHGSTPIVCAAEHSHLDVVRYLLAHGADVRAPNRSGCTALNIAAIAGHVELCRVLLKAGAPVNWASTTGSTALHDAAEGGHLDLCRLLVAHGGNPNMRTQRGSTPLTRAAWKGYFEVVKYLVSDAGANVEQANKLGGTALIAGVPLLSVPPPRSVAPHVLNVRYVPVFGLCACVCAAAEAGSLSIVKWLHDTASADPFAVTAHGNSGLLCAAEFGHTHVVEYLLSVGLPVNCRNSAQSTPLSRAGAWSGLSLSVAFCVFVCVCVSLSFSLSLPPALCLFLLLSVSLSPLFLFLSLTLTLYLSFNLCVFLSSRVSVGLCSLAFVPCPLPAAKGHLECVKLLLRHGADPNLVDTYGDSPLTLALHFRRTAVVKDLVDAGACRFFLRRCRFC